MSVSFRTLFERSKFCGSRKLLVADEAERKQIMEQHERFAVGAVGFVMDHDPDFPSHFLDRICELRNLPTGGKWEVLVEPENWGDLVLTHKDLSWLVVVEFKIDAVLEDHQNPTKPAFNEPTPAKGAVGYGCGITWFAHDQGLRNVKYVTVEKEASWETGNRCPNVNCIPSVWKRLMRNDVADESDLEACLYDSLGRLGLYTFLARKMNGMKLANHATAPLDLLISVLAACRNKHVLKCTCCFCWPIRMLFACERIISTGC
jgi:hypothetical protein